MRLSTYTKNQQITKQEGETMQKTMLITAFGLLTVIGTFIPVTKAVEVTSTDFSSLSVDEARSMAQSYAGLSETLTVARDSVTQMSGPLKWGEYETKDFRKVTKQEMVDHGSKYSGLNVLVKIKTDR